MLFDFGFGFGFDFDFDFDPLRPSRTVVLRRAGGASSPPDVLRAVDRAAQHLVQESWVVGHHRRRQVVRHPFQRFQHQPAPRKPLFVCLID